MKNKYKAYILDQNCASRRVLELVASKWRALIMCALGSGPHRYNELLRRIEGISQKVLTQNLRGLERDGLVERRTRGTAPEKTDYVLSQLGTILNGPLRRICKWGEEHLDELDAVRSRDRV